MSTEKQRDLGTIWYTRILFAVMVASSLVLLVYSFSSRIDPGQIDLLYFLLFAFGTAGSLNRVKHITNMLERRGGRAPEQSTPPQG